MTFFVRKWWPTVPDPPGLKRENGVLTVEVENVEYFAELSKKYSVMIITRENGERWIELDQHRGRFRAR
jgi:hypothetical protein